MIFVSVGSMLPFERLVQAMDAWAGAHPDTKVVIQYGNGAYKPAHAQGFASILLVNLTIKHGVNR